MPDEQGDIQEYRTRITVDTASFIKDFEQALREARALAKAGSADALKAYEGVFKGVIDKMVASGKDAGVVFGSLKQTLGLTKLEAGLLRNMLEEIGVWATSASQQVQEAAKDASRVAKQVAQETTASRKMAAE